MTITLSLPTTNRPQVRRNQVRQKHPPAPNTAAADDDSSDVLKSRSELTETDRNLLANAMTNHRSRLLAVARRFFRCEADCADAVQDAFLSAVRAFPSFRRQCRMETWLHQIVVNCCRLKRRTMKRTAAESLDVQHESMVPDREQFSGICDDERAALRSALCLLSERHRSIIQLRYFEGFSTKEVAALLGLHSQTVKTRLLRARRALRTVMATQSGGTW